MLRKDKACQGRKAWVGLTLLAILLVLVACGSAEVTASANEGVWTEQEVLKNMDPSSISCISFAVGTEGGVRQGKVEDVATIEEVYLRLCDVSVAGPTDMAVVDDGLYLSVEAGAQKLSFSFEENILVLEDGSRYEVEQLGALKGYLGSMLEDGAPVED